MHNQIASTTTPRRGFTVIELLVVMGIIVIVAAVTLPTLKTLLSGRKIAEAANIVSSYAASAKSRAIATGRPVALILDRTRYDGEAGLALNNVCTRISIGDVFPAYTGDWAGAEGTLVDEVAIDAHEVGFADAIDVPLAQAATLIDPATRVSTGMVQDGDLIEIGTSREKFFIASNQLGPAIELLTGGPTPVVRIRFNNPSETTGGVPMQEGAMAASYLAAGAQHSFRIFRRPSKSLAGGVSLPRGTCIDLNFSGFGPSGRDFSSDAIQPIGGASPPPYPDIANSNYGPIYLVFSPDGQVSSWYVQNREFNYASPTLQRGFPRGLIHLLVGSMDKLVDSPRLNPTLAISDNEELQTNLMDGENNWVTVNPYTGGIHTSTVQATTVAANAPAPNQNDPASLLEYRLVQARSLATNFLSIPNQGE
ncbi:MAG: hypothetical protein Aurels2KO_07310 [Aureliella sp.]